MTWADPRTWTTGELVTAAYLNQDLRDNLTEVGPHKRVRKTVSEDLASSTTLQDDDALFFAVGANEVWLFQLFVSFQGGTTEDIKFTMVGPTGSTVTFGIAPQWATGDPFVVTTANAGGTAVALGASTARVAHIVGIIVNGSTAGDCKLQWAQNVSGATVTTVLVNSWLLAHRIG